MDYHIHQGNQANSLIALKVVDGLEVDINSGFLAWTGINQNDPSSAVFMSKETQHVHYLLNQIGLYTWSDSTPALDAGCNSADLKLAINTKLAVDTIQNLIRSRLCQTVAYPGMDESFNWSNTRKKY